MLTIATATNSTWNGHKWDNPEGTLGPDPDNPLTSCFTHCTSYNPDLPAGCQRRAPKGLNGRGTPLWIYKGWASLDMTSYVLKILYRDVLGYRNITIMWGAWKSGIVSSLPKPTACMPPSPFFSRVCQEPIRSMGGPGPSTTGDPANVCKASDGKRSRLLLRLNFGS